MNYKPLHFVKDLQNAQSIELKFWTTDFRVDIFYME